MIIDRSKTPESTRAKFSISNNSNTIKTIFFSPIFRQTQILSKFRITRVPAYCFLFFAAFPLLYLLAIYNGRGGNLPKIRNLQNQSVLLRYFETNAAQTLW